MTKQCRQPNVSPTGDISHGRIDTMRGNGVTRDCKQMAVIFFGVGSHVDLDKWIGDPYNLDH